MLKLVDSEVETTVGCVDQFGVSKGRKRKKMFKSMHIDESLAYFTDNRTRRLARCIIQLISTVTSMVVSCSCDQSLLVLVE